MNGTNQNLEESSRSKSSSLLYWIIFVTVALGIGGGIWYYQGRIDYGCVDTTMWYRDRNTGRCEMFSISCGAELALGPNWIRDNTCGIRNKTVEKKIGEDVEVRGVVTNINTEPLGRDGDGVLVLQTENKGINFVLIPAEMFAKCKTKDVLETFLKLKVNDRVEALGTLTNKDEITVCDSETHYLNLLIDNVNN